MPSIPCRDEGGVILILELVLGFKVHFCETSAQNLIGQ